MRATRWVRGRMMNDHVSRETALNCSSIVLRGVTPTLSLRCPGSRFHVKRQRRMQPGLRGFDSGRTAGWAAATRSHIDNPVSQNSVLLPYMARPLRYFSTGPTRGHNPGPLRSRNHRRPTVPVVVGFGTPRVSRQTARGDSKGRTHHESPDRHARTPHQAARRHPSDAELGFTL